jgi:tetratricopeptide (TPR) repeat protein
MRGLRRLLAAASLVLLGYGVYKTQWAIELSRQGREQADSLYLPNGKLLPIVSLGYDNVMADVLWLYSIQYVMEQFWGRHKYVWLYHIFDLITELDPQFEAAYVQGAMFLGMMQGRPKKAIELLEKGKRNNPDSWIYPAEQSFYSALQLRNRKQALEYLKEAASKPGSPPQLYSRLANLYRTMGKAELALRQWTQIEQSTHDPKFRKVAQANIEWYLQQLAKQYPKWALQRWQSIARTTTDPSFAELAGGHAKELAERLGKLPADQHGPEKLPEESIP